MNPLPSRFRLLLSGMLLGLGGCQVGPPTRPFVWLERPTGVAASLRGLAVADARRACVGGANGTLLLTTDGGRSWRDIAPAGSEACDFRDVEFVGDAIVAMVAGQPARIYRSNDGYDWTVVHEDPRPDAFFDAVAFDGEVGAVFGDAIDGVFGLLVSDDGGRTWQDRAGAVLPAPIAGEAAFAASGTCLAARGGGSRRFSLVTGGGGCRHVDFAAPASDAGTTVDLPLASGGTAAGAFSIAWRGDAAVVVGGDYTEGRRRGRTGAITADGGASWRPVDPGGYRSAVAWIDADSLMSVGSHGCSYSADRGATWLPFGTVGFHAVAVAKDGAVWACGSDGRVARLGRLP